jgi:Uncharacterized alpha/beta hydrolase domain (DUF2235)
MRGVMAHMGSLKTTNLSRNTPAPIFFSAQASEHQPLSDFLRSRATNVVKLYAMLDRTRNDQLCHYQPGIGTFPPPGVWGRLKRWFTTRLDLAIAFLLSDHVTDAYRILMRYYQEGDSIFIFGFSRGAYTARVLAAMLHKVGLLTPSNEGMIPFAWDIYKNQRDETISDGFKSHLLPAGARPFPWPVGHGKFDRLGVGSATSAVHTKQSIG